MITQETVNAALKEITKAYPEADDNGLADVGDSSTPLDFKNDADFLKQVIASYEWLILATAKGTSATINKYTDSYGIKHNVESWSSRNKQGRYISNMAAIVGLWLHPDTRIELGHAYDLISGRKYTNRNPYTNLRSTDIH